jgi:hypothetical protein
MEIIGWRCGWLLLGLGFETSNMRVKHAHQTPMNNGGCCCLTATMVPHSRHRVIQQSADMLYNRSTLLNSLTAKSVPAGTKNSRSEGFLPKHLKHTAHKHHHNDGAVCPSSGKVLLDEHTPPPGAYAKGVDRGHRRMVLVESIN